MCGIVGVVSYRDVKPIIVDGLQRLEYRGYDSAGIAVLDGQQGVGLRRVAGRVGELDAAVGTTGIRGNTGIGHTRWATHGEPSETNAHPQVSGSRVAVVHNGIIDNHYTIREELTERGYVFVSDTDTEVIAHLVDDELKRTGDLQPAVAAARERLRGAFAIGTVDAHSPGRLLAVRRGSPLVIGIGDDEYFLASDSNALLTYTRDFVFLEDGDLAEVRVDGCWIHDAAGDLVERPAKRSDRNADDIDRGGFPHYMLKEIHEQPQALERTIAGRVSDDAVVESAFGSHAGELLDRVQSVQIIACGTSFHAGLVGRYWIEQLTGLPCQVEVASEFRYRQAAVMPDTLSVFVSQSGETADTLGALRWLTHPEQHRDDTADRLPTLAICNVPESSLEREADLVFRTHAGPEIGVASTKAFTTQLVSLLLIGVALGRRQGMPAGTQKHLLAELGHWPDHVRRVGELDSQLRRLASTLVDRSSVLFIGRGVQYPVAMEGALKLKEISYLHAEAFAAGELKHGPLALVDSETPVIAVAPDNYLLAKLLGNLEEIRARGGRLIVLADEGANVVGGPDVTILPMPSVDDFSAPLTNTVALQLLAYHTAVLRGNNVDKPRNLAKSVTVE